MADSRKHLIIDNCLATIGAITAGATYNRTVRKAVRNALTLPETPVNDAVWIEHTAQTEVPLVSGLAQATLTITFGCLVVDASDLGKAIDDIQADVERALAADVTRGGYALDTRVVRREEMVAESGSPLGGVLIDVEILYRHADGNPYAAS
jgi:hypothetical protein